MKINYKDADGISIEIEVSEKVGSFYLESLAEEKKNDRRNARPDRHTQLSTFEYEDAKFFSDGTDLLADLIDTEAVLHAMELLTDRQQYLIKMCCLEGWSYTDLAAMEGKHESAIRHAVNRAKQKLKKHLG